MHDRWQLQIKCHQIYCKEMTDGHFRHTLPWNVLLLFCANSEEQLDRRADGDEEEQMRNGWEALMAPATHHSGTGCPCTPADTGRCHCVCHKGPGSHMPGRAPGSQAPSVPPHTLHRETQSKWHTDSILGSQLQAICPMSIRAWQSKPLGSPRFPEACKQSVSCSSGSHWFHLSCCLPYATSPCSTICVQVWTSVAWFS